MNFIKAFYAMQKQHAIVRRQAWVSKGGDVAIMMINNPELVQGAHGVSICSWLCTSHSQIVQVVNGVPIDTPWEPDQEDIMSEDWEVCHSEKTEARKIKKAIIRHCEKIDSVLKDLRSVRYETKGLSYFSLFKIEEDKETEILQSLDKALSILEERRQWVRKKIES